MRFLYLAEINLIEFYVEDISIFMTFIYRNPSYTPPIRELLIAFYILCLHKPYPRTLYSPVNFSIKFSQMIEI